ncbi:hypothetical protein BJ166DRAFT_504319 [Pestalotiopsis sp. NC0098]|nr:hypothetical protein BJ166DRAFT_504319 [Pestalotiopsis sp. NC0098]
MSFQTWTRGLTVPVPRLLLAELLPTVTLLRTMRPRALSSLQFLSYCGGVYSRSDKAEPRSRGVHGHHHPKCSMFTLISSPPLMYTPETPTVGTWVNCRYQQKQLANREHRQEYQKTQDARGWNK